MNFAAKSILLLALLLLNSLAPGLIVLRPLRLKPHERLCAAIGLSQFISFLIAFTIYAVDAPVGWYWLLTVVGVISTIVVHREIRRLLAHPIVRYQVRAFFVCLVLALCAVAMIRNFSGGMWGGDWLEHYQRTRFFLDHHARDELFLGMYHLPARPPMMNVLAAAYMAQIRDGSYAAFQLCFVFLNVLVVTACVAMLPLLGARALRRPAWALIFLLAANPMFLHNATWTWTRMLTNFYVLIAVRFYLRGWRRSDSVRMVLAFAALAVGTLVHYSTGPWIVVLAAHYAWTLLAGRWRRRPLEPIIAALISLAILATWLGWAIGAYGVRGTLSSNTTFGTVLPREHPRSQIFWYGFYYSMVPHPLSLQPGAFDANFQQVSRLGYLRDYVFSIYQSTFLFAFGSINGLIAAIILLRFLLSRRTPERMKWFWAWFVAGGLVLSILVVSSVELLGIAHVCYQSVFLLGLVLIAANIGRMPLWLRALIFIGCICDFALGVYLHFLMQHANPTLLSQFAQMNWHSKLAAGLVYVADHISSAGDVVVQVIFIGLFALLAGVMLRCVVARIRIPAR